MESSSSFLNVGPFSGTSNDLLRTGYKKGPASKRRAVGGFSKNREVIFTFAGCVEVQIPEQRILAVAVFTGQQSRTRSEKAVGNVTFDINTASLGVYSGLPLMNIVAGGTGKIPFRYRFAINVIKEREKIHLAFRVSTGVAEDFARRV